MINKKGFEMSFNWLFAIIVGAFILFLGIYAATKLIGTEQTTQDAKTAKEIGILLNPLEIGFESNKIISLSLPVESRIYNKCDTFGTFGRQIIQVSQKNFDKWTKTDVEISFQNKYLFSEEYSEGKEFYVFSKPFNFPFKISDLIYITPKNKKYCFVNAPEEVKKEINYSGQENLLIEDCTNESVKVCFKGNACEINVNYGGKTIYKDGETVYFEGDSLMYAGIFGESKIYECQVQRIMQRLSELLLLYKEKSTFISRVGCDSNLGLDLLKSKLENYKDSGDLNSINSLVKEIEIKNNLAECKLW